MIFSNINMADGKSQSSLSTATLQRSWLVDSAGKHIGIPAMIMCLSLDQFTIIDFIFAIH